MDAWGSLISGSTIASGDAWEHLLAAQGSGTASYVVLTDGVQIEMSMGDIEITVDQDAVEITVEQQDIEVTVDQSPMEVEI